MVFSLQLFFDNSVLLSLLQVRFGGGELVSQPFHLLFIFALLKFGLHLSDVGKVLFLNLSEVVTLAATCFPALAHALVAKRFSIPLQAAPG